MFKMKDLYPFLFAIATTGIADNGMSFEEFYNWESKHGINSTKKCCTLEEAKELYIDAVKKASRWLIKEAKEYSK